MRNILSPSRRLAQVLLPRRAKRASPALSHRDVSVVAVPHRRNHLQDDVRRVVLRKLALLPPQTIYGAPLQPI